MLHIRNLLFCTAVCAFASCTADGPSEQLSDLKTIEGGISVEESSTRTTFIEDELRGMQGVYWTSGDCIGVFSASGNENARFNSSVMADPAGKASFTGKMKGNPAYAYYPFAEGNSNRESVQGTLPLEQVYSHRNATLQYDYKYGTPIAKSSDKFKFQHVFPMLRFVVNAQGTAFANEKLRSVSITFPAQTELHSGPFNFSAQTGQVAWQQSATTGHEIKLTWEDTPVMSENETIYGYYFCDAASQMYNQELTVTVLTENHKISFPATMRMNQFKPNFIYNFPLILKKWQEKLEDQFDVAPAEDGLIIDQESADNSEVLDVLS